MPGGWSGAHPETTATELAVPYASAVHGSTARHASETALKHSSIRLQGMQRKISDNLHLTAAFIRHQLCLCIIPSIVDIFILSASR